MTTRAPAVLKKDQSGDYVLEKDPVGSKVLERNVFVSSSEIKAEKEQSDYECDYDGGRNGKKT